MIINAGKKLITKAALIAVVLIISAAAQTGGLPGEFLVTDRWRSLYSMYSGVTNPAYIAAENHIAVRAAAAPVLQGAFTLSEVGVNVPVSLYQTVGFTMLMEGAGAAYEDAFDENTGKLVSDAKSPLSNSDLMFSLGYAWHIWRRLTVGANLNFAYQTNFGAPLMGMGIDVGVNYRIYKHPVFGDHTLGFATNNIVNTIDEKYAAALRFSLLSGFWKGRISYGADFVLKDFLADAEEFQASGPGLESFAKSMPWEFNHRLGVNVWRVFKLYGLVGFDENVVGHYGFAFGAKLPGVLGRSVEAAYQYVVMAEENSDASAHTLFLRMEFGKHREESFAAR